MKCKRVLSLLLLIVTVPLSVSAQEWCATDHQRDILATQNLAAAARLNLTDSLLSTLPVQSSHKSKTGATVYTIPVVFHVVYNDYTDNIHKSQILDAMRILNEDFRRLNADTTNTRGIFKPLAADIEIEFALATLDPNGNPTDGITRTQSTLSVDATNAVKSVVSWNRNKYMNVWVVKSIGISTGTSGVILGYSSFPQAGGQSGTNDGTVIRHDALGTIGTGTRGGRTLTHETGHYLSLYHTFQSGCSGGDQVSDTPPSAQANYGCDLTLNSCSNDSPDMLDQIENYMDYSDDNCQNMFTDGQKTRMVAVVSNTSLRANLVSSTNLSSTGVTSPVLVAPTADFRADRYNACAGETIQFNEYYDNGEATSIQWSFPGGTPATSTSDAPMVTYANPGSYDVTITMSNAAGTDTKTVTKAIHIKRSIPAYAPLWVETFENSTTTPSPEVSAFDYGDGYAFKVFQGAGSEGNQSLVLENSQTVAIGGVDDIYTPSFNTSAGGNLNFIFDVAFAKKTSADNDELRVYASRDCGATWLQRRSYSASQLATVANTNGNFVPGANDWQTIVVPMSAYSQNDPVMMKLEFTAGGGNDIYIDYMRFGIGTDISLNENELLSSNVFPNPANNTLNVTFESPLGGTYHLNDLSGKQIRSASFESTNHLELKIEDLPKGIYMLQLQTKNGTGVHKIVKE